MYFIACIYRCAEGFFGRAQNYLGKYIMRIEYVHIHFHKYPPGKLRIEIIYLIPFLYNPNTNDNTRMIHLSINQRTTP